MDSQFQKLKIPEVILIKPKVYSDQRGFFLEHYKKTFFAFNGIKDDFVQDNHSLSQKNVLRGLHYQLNPKAQSKLVSVIKGEIFDVAVDIRKNSLTYGKWVGEFLNEQNCYSLYIPEGFAHGFCVLSDEAHVLYKVNNEYSPEHEKGIIWNDPTINIEWPTDNPLISPKDLELPSFELAENNFAI